MGQARSVIGLVFVLAVAAACGGKTEGEEDGDGGDGTPPPAPSPSDGSTPGDGTAPIGDTALGPCMPGFSPEDEPGHACDWLADGLCYDSKVAACSCVCPLNKKDSSCVSGFYEPNGRTRVSCF